MVIKMGNDGSIFKKIHIGDQVYSSAQYSLHSAHYNNKQLSVFFLNKFDNEFDLWKSVRHPFILKYYDCGLFRGKRCIVTERIEPVKPLLQYLSSDEITSGLNDIASALLFLHQNCNVSHNNIFIDSLFACRSNHSWKLGSLYLASRPGQETNEMLKDIISYHQELGLTGILPPEDNEQKFGKLIEDHKDVHRRDAYSFGILLRQLLTSSTESLDCLKHEHATKRPNFSYVLNDKIFSQCEYLKIKSFVNNFPCFCEEEKKSFLISLPSRLKNIPSKLMAEKAIPIILTTRLVMLHPEANHIHPYLFIPESVPNKLIQNPLTSKSLFMSHIIPVICKLYCVKNISLRLILLEYLPYYASLMSKIELNDIVLPQILLGLKDVNDVLVAATLNGLAHLVHDFGASIMGPRLKIFSNTMPKLKSTTQMEKSASTERLPSPSDLQERSEPDGGESGGRITPLQDNVDVEVDDHHYEASSPIGDSGDGDGDTDREEYLDLATEPILKEDVSEKKSKTKTRELLKLKNNPKISLKLTKKNPVAAPKLDLDLENIEIRVVNRNIVDDFFSEMEPKCQFKKTLQDEDVQETKRSSLFEFTEDNRETSGWDEEFQDWEQELNQT